MEDRVTHYAEAEMAGLNDSCMNRSDRHLTNTDSIDLQKPILPMSPRYITDLTFHRMDAIGPILVKDKRSQVGMPVHIYPELIVKFAFVPSRSRSDRCCRWERAVYRDFQYAVLSRVEIEYVVDPLFAC